MNIRRIEEGDDVAGAAELSSREHERLRARLPYLSARTAGDFAQRIGWVAREGHVAGLFEGRKLEAFLGGFIIDDFRNEGAGAFCPDWCHGSASESFRASFDAYRALYRELAPAWRSKGATIHAACAYASDSTALEAFSMTGFGRIMMDAARPASELVDALRDIVPLSRSLALRRAEASDARELSRLDSSLAAHIASSPVLGTDPHGRDEGQWREWLDRDGAVAFVAEGPAGLAGFMKAEEPQFDVSYAVHGEATLAIDGLFVDPALRGKSVAACLLSLIARHAVALGRSLVSVDCETMNPEAYGFWSARFAPLAFGLERRT
jgi:Acetyltransferase (GNAT) family.